MHLLLDFARTENAGDPFAFRVGPQQYMLRGTGGGAETAVLSWEPALLADLRAVQQPGADPAVAQRLGDTLRSFLTPLGWALHAARIADAVERGQQVYITIRSSAAELYALPWELLVAGKGTGQPLGAMAGVLIRYAWPETNTTAEQPQPRPEGGRILLAYSAAGGAVPAAEHQAALQKACDRGHHPFDAQRDVLNDLSLGRLQATLEEAARADQPISVLHILCHGGQRGQTFGLWWNGEAAGDEPVVVDAGRLRDLLAAYAGHVRLVVLCACNSGNFGNLGNHLGSVAQMLHRAGVQAVIASRFPLSVMGSVQFAGAFYDELLASPGSVESAFVAAQKELVRDVHSLDWASLQLYSRPEDGEDSRPVVFRPYRGLLTFTARHSRFFFGRDTERQAILSGLRALREAQQARLLIVAGASGSGKSSIVLAGVVPDLVGAAPDAGNLATDQEALQRTLFSLTLQLRGRAQSRTMQQLLSALSQEIEAMGSIGHAWQVASFRPGADPMTALTSALAERRDPARSFLLVVDQFEELFTYNSDPAVRQAFARRLWALSKDDTGVHCIITLRVDFLDQCGPIVLDESGLSLERVAYDDAHRVFVTQLGPQQLLHAIEDPARLCGLRLEEGLARRMIAEVAGEPGALSLLEYTLDLLWQRRSAGILTAESYNGLGGVVGAIEQKANQLLLGLGSIEQKQARRLLVHLVGIADNGTIDARRRVPLAALREREVASEAEFDAMLAAFVQARLLVLGEQGGQVMVEVAHEALIRHWELLRRWVDEDRGMLAELQEVERWVEQWQEYKTLLHGAQLGYATRVLEKYGDDLRPAAKELIATSQRAEEQASQRAREEARQRQEQQQRELAAAQALAVEKAKAATAALDAAARQRRRTRLATMLGVLAFLFAVGSAFLYRKALRQEKLSEDRLYQLYVEHGRVELERAEPLRALVYLSKIYTPSGPSGAELLMPLAQAARAADAQLVSLEGHQDLVDGVAFAPDGQRVVTASFDKTAKIWDAQSGQLVLTLNGHTEHLRSAAFSPDGARVVTASDDHTARIWDASTGAVVFTLQGHTAVVTSACFSSDGTRVLTTSWDHDAKIWDAQSGRVLRTLRGHQNWVLDGAFESSGARVATASFDNEVMIWDSNTGQSQSVLRGHGGPVQSVSWSTDGTRIITSSNDGTVRLWDVAGGKTSLILSGHRGPVESAVFSMDGSLVVTASRDRTIKLWDAKDGRELRTLIGHQSALNMAALSADGSRIVSASNDRTARIWDALSSQEMLSWKVSGMDSTFSPDGTRLVANADGQAVKIWDPVSGQPLPQQSATLGSATRVVFSAAGAHLAILTADWMLRVWNLKAGTESTPINLGGYNLDAIALSPDGTRLAIARIEDYTAHIRDVQSGQELLTLRGHEGFATSACFSPDGARLVTASIDDTVRIWDVGRGQEIHTLRGHSDSVTSAAFSPDGNRVVSTSKDHTAKIWDARHGNLLGSLIGHHDAVTTAAFSADGNRVVTGGEDGTVTVWDVRSGQTLATLNRHLGSIKKATFSPDGTRIFTISEDRVATIWDISAEARTPEQIAALVACSALDRLDEMGRLQPTEPRSVAAECRHAAHPQSLMQKRVRANNLRAAALLAAKAHNLTWARSYGQQVLALWQDLDARAEVLQTHLLLGEVAEQSGDDREARSQRQQAQPLCQSSASVQDEGTTLHLRGSCEFVTLHDAEMALADLDRACLLLPKDPVVHNDRAEAELAAARYDAFFRDLPGTLALETDPSLRTVLLAFAWTASVLGGRADQPQRARDLVAAYQKWPAGQKPGWVFGDIRRAIKRAKAAPADIARVLDLLALVEQHGKPEDLRKPLGLTP